jgi:endoglucanase
MYNQIGGNGNIANIATDDLNTIKEKWSQWNTPEYFSPNKTVISALQKATESRNIKHPTQAFTSNSGK